MKTPKNVIILTGGLTGSSVLTSIFTSSGYWAGDDTKKKPDYDTLENAELVDLNEYLLECAGFSENWIMKFSPDYINQVTNAAPEADRLKGFIEKCNQNQPWIWKDPRLWLTIRHWIRHIPKENTCFIILGREPLQAWISGTLRRQIQSFDYIKAYYGGIQKSFLDLLGAEGLAYIYINYEDLILHPQSALQKINAFAGTELTLANLESNFKGKLRQRQHGIFNFLKAVAIYLKNYSERHYLKPDKPALLIKQQAHAPAQQGRSQVS